MSGRVPVTLVMADSYTDDVRDRTTFSGAQPCARSDGGASTQRPWLYPARSARSLPPWLVRCREVTRRSEAPLFGALIRCDAVELHLAAENLAVLTGRRGIPFLPFFRVLNFEYVVFADENVKLSERS